MVRAASTHRASTGLGLQRGRMYSTSGMSSASSVAMTSRRMPLAMRPENPPACWSDQLAYCVTTADGMKATTKSASSGLSVRKASQARDLSDVDVVIRACETR